jgi:hypothetical protein
VSALEPDPTEMTEILYIAGYGRSGSTVLDAVLGAHPRLFGAGELTNLFEGWFRGEGVCSCGEAVYGGCPFWARVLDDVRQAVPGLDADALQRATRRLQSTRLRPGADDAAAQTYADAWGALFGAIARVSGRPVVVDSSKSGRFCTRRIQRLHAMMPGRVKVLHLVRDPRAVTFSRRRGDNRLLEAGRPGAHGVLRTLFGWTRANAAVHVAQREIPGLPVLRVRYEEFVRDAPGVLQRIGAFAGHDLSALAGMAAAGEAFEAGHGIAGNRTRRQGALRIRADEEWRGAMRRGDRVWSLLTRPLARRYGY